MLKFSLILLFILIFTERQLFAADVTSPIPSVSENPQNIDLNFVDIPVRQVLQLLAQFMGFNIIINDNVNGNITLHLNHLTAEQALDIILQSQGLGQQKIGNVLLIAPMADITQREQQQLQAQQQLANLVPLQSVLIQINYGKASDIAVLLKDKNNTLLSSRGNVSVDNRTNTLWIEDTSQKLLEIRQLINQLDVPTKEVLIEARIVNVDEKYEQELGVRFGLTRPENNISGTFLGANQLANNPNPAAMSNPLSRLNVDLPAANTGVAGGAASWGIALAKLSNSNLLDLELSALESEGGGEIISSPRLMTANQQPAVILSGQEIPYQQSTTSGATSIAFQKAVLSLSVTPQITPDKKLILNLQLSQDRPGSTMVQGVPTIDTRQIQTQVLVDNGQTIVLGGIYEQNDQKQVERVPFLGELPIIGNLFRHSITKKDRKELLIFVTPRIVE